MKKAVIIIGAVFLRFKCIFPMGTRRRKLIKAYNQRK
jgi:hypothetical protein